MTDDDFETRLAESFALRPSGPDWDRLTTVVQDMERRKKSALPAAAAMLDIADIRVVSYMAVVRASAVTDKQPKMFNLANSWAEGFLFGVLFQQAGGTLSEHHPVAEKTVLTGAMRPQHESNARAALDPPRSPDLATMQLVTQDIEARFGSDLTTEGLFNEIVDVYAMAYIGANRVGLTYPDLAYRDAVDCTDAWAEGFMYGVLFQRAGGTVRMD